MPDKEREDFIDRLSSKLTGYVGPAAVILIGDALKTLGHGSEMLAREEIPRIIESVSDPLEKEERESLARWGLGYLQK